MIGFYFGGSSEVNMERKTLANHVSSERGAALVEYVLLVACIALVSLMSVQSLSASINQVFTKASNGVECGGSGGSSGGGCVDPEPPPPP